MRLFDYEVIFFYIQHLPPGFWIEWKLLVSSLPSKLYGGSRSLAGPWALNLHQFFSPLFRLMRLDPLTALQCWLLKPCFQNVCDPAPIPRPLLHVAPFFPLHFCSFLDTLFLLDSSVHLQLVGVLGKKLFVESGAWISDYQRAEPLCSLLFILAFDTSQQ